MTVSVRAFAAAAVLVLVAACGSDAAAPPSGAQSLTISGHAATELGTGPTAIVMAHGSSTAKESWYPLLPPLATAGYTVLALDLGSDREGAVRAAVTYVREHGARRVVLMGSSRGAENVLDVARDGGFAAIVTFSAVTTVTATLPVLAIASQDDPTADTVTIARAIVAGSGKGSESFVVPGSTHGVDLVPGHPEAVTKVVSWLSVTLG